MVSFSPVVSDRAPCKVCDEPAPLYGVVDFNRSCEDHRRPPLPLSGIPIYYYGCPRCGMMFTTAFDAFTNDDFARHIYNEGYHEVDPEFASSRPLANARTLTATFLTSPRVSILDYGGGSGALAGHLRTAGFTDVTTYDPFFAAHAEKPQRRFDLITCFEVLEHTPAPGKTLDDIVALLNPDGMVFFTTLVIPKDISQQRMNWWYVAPRNGHVTFYSRLALRNLLAARGLNFGSQDDLVHAAWRQVPTFARHFIREVPPAPQAPPR